MFLCRYCRYTYKRVISLTIGRGFSLECLGKMSSRGAIVATTNGASLIRKTDASEIGRGNSPIENVLSPLIKENMSLLPLPQHARYKYIDSRYGRRE